MDIEYIPRRLIINAGQSSERTVDDSEILSFGAPIVILGDPGLGKSRLMQKLAKSLHTKVIPAGTFYRSSDLTRFSSADEAPLIIDGLDEITGATGSPVDEILKKLSKLNNPRFIISCRAADWQGVTDRHKILSDYGVAPITFLLSRLTRDDALAFLSQLIGNRKAGEILEELESRGLNDFVGNPLTLSLIGELSISGKSLPKSRADLLSSACELLLSERNNAHKRDGPAVHTKASLLDAAGGVFAHLILSGSVGVADLPASDTPIGYVPLAEAASLAAPGVVSAAIRSRLFQSGGENLLVPVHRIIAEFLAARWTAEQLEIGLSQRRLFAALTFGDGVPSALRGLHAWLGYFDKNAASQVITNDPYGFLRYGDIARLPLPLAELLLNSLDRLANEDPYFRSEDWGRKSIEGLARPELKDRIQEIITRPRRHYQLSTLFLQSIKGTSLAKGLERTLIAILLDKSGIFAERSAAAEALLASEISTDWTALISRLRGEKTENSKRLAVEVVALRSGQGISAETIAAIILENHGTFADDGRSYVFGTDFLLVQKLHPKLCSRVVDELTKSITERRPGPYWVPSGALATTINQLIARAITVPATISAKRIWSWLTALGRAHGYASEAPKAIQEFFNNNPGLRSEVQRHALWGIRSDGGDPWMEIHHLAQANVALALTAEDYGIFISEIGSKKKLSEDDVKLWSNLVLASLPLMQDNDNLRILVNEAANQHSRLKDEFERITTPPKRDWKKEHDKRVAREESARKRKFAKFRDSLLPEKAQIASGEASGALRHLARGYLKHFYELNNDLDPVERLRDWVGSEITEAALAGFDKYLKRDDLPTAAQISAAHADRKEYYAESVILCGVFERVRAGKSLEDLPLSLLQAALTISWSYPEGPDESTSRETRRQLEHLVVREIESAEQFLSDIVEPSLAAGNSYIPAVSKLANDEELRVLGSTLSVNWLNAYPNCDLGIQRDLFDIAARSVSPSEMQRIIRTEQTRVRPGDLEREQFWMAAAFVFDFEAQKKELSDYFDVHPTIIWAIRDLIHPREARHALSVGAKQIGFLLTKLAGKYAPTPHPSAGWGGNTNLWDASDFLYWAIGALASDPSPEAGAIFDSLHTKLGNGPYADQIRHAHASQRRLARDKSYRNLSFEEAKHLLANSLPTGIDDLKAWLLDQLQSTQVYIQSSDTDPWQAFWDDDTPKEENECRHRLLDLMRSKISNAINLMPEVLMPDGKRADIVAVYQQFGIPVEIKGQWHPQIWNAASTQLNEQYAGDWRAYGRGIYVALWFGSDNRKKLTRHPKGKPAPKSPQELKSMLVEELTADERKLIDVFVMDLSKPEQRAKGKVRGKPKSKSKKKIRK